MNEQEPAATTERAGAKRRCPEEARQHYRRAGESGASVDGCRKRDVKPATVRWKPDRAETVYRLRLRQRRFPSGKSPAGRHNRKKNRQNSDISQYAIGMATIGNDNDNDNDNAEIINRTGISPTGYNTSILIL